MKQATWLILYCIGIISYGQNSSAQSDFSTYYYQKKSLFELLPNTENEIIFLGNSITDGGEWVELFGNQNIKNRGISGDITDGVLFRLNEVVESHPLKIFIMIGINDLAIGRSPDQIIENYEKILDRINTFSPETAVYIQSILPVNDDFGIFRNHTDKLKDIGEINQRLKLLANAKNCRFIDLDPFFKDAEGKLKTDYTNDGLHLTGPGYIAWKQALGLYVCTQ